MQGHLHKRTHTSKTGKTSTRWYVVFDSGRNASGKRKQKWHGGFSTRKEAEVARAKLIADVHDGAYVEPTKLTFEAWIIQRWIPSMKTQLKASTFDSYKRNLNNHVIPFLGNTSLTEITPHKLNNLYTELLLNGNKRGGGLSAKTVRYIHTTLHKALADAKDEGLIRNNPAERAKPPLLRTSLKKDMNVWDAKTLGQFLEYTSDERLGPAWHVLAMTGIRRGELLGLRWNDIDSEHKRIIIRHTLVSVSYQIIESTPKNHQTRIIDIDDSTIQILRKQQESQNFDRSNWASIYADSDLVFSRENGTPIHPDSLSQSFERAIKRAGAPRIRLHDLRHTHATLAMQAGVPIKVISERLGHESPSFTMKQYAHVLPTMQAEAASIIANLILEQQQ
ncbi:MAG TPA: site-specific integrase [Acidimicrobiia bacterium]|nr:site-specific integrase [Acidimicrobiia bacterium]